MYHLDKFPVLCQCYITYNHVAQPRAPLIICNYFTNFTHNQYMRPYISLHIGPMFFANALQESWWYLKLMKWSVVWGEGMHGRRGHVSKLWMRIEDSSLESVSWGGFVACIKPSIYEDGWYKRTLWTWLRPLLCLSICRILGCWHLIRRQGLMLTTYVQKNDKTWSYNWLL
jgi:hypothetical protein